MCTTNKEKHPNDQESGDTCAHDGGCAFVVESTRLIGWFDYSSRINRLWTAFPRRSK